MTVWDVKRDGERMQWNFVPLVSVGPLKFGANHEEVVAALDGARAGSSLQDWRTESWLEEDFRDLGVIAYYRDQQLFCVAVDGRNGPQVTFEGTALTGRAPSAVEQWMTDQAQLLPGTRAGSPRNPPDSRRARRHQRDSERTDA